MTTFAAAVSVRIGGYALEVGTPAGSFARFEPEQESENAQELGAALEEEPEERPAAVAAIEEFEESAEAVTGRIEEAERLLRAAAARRLDPAQLSGEVDSLLDLLGRLDKAGRFGEELALMRSLNGLLALSLRWLELVRSLRSLLGSAEAARHTAGQAWAHHELGSLHLCAGQAEKAARHLGEALGFEEEVGDLASRCATRHNLDAARRDRALQRGGARPPRRLLRLGLLAAVFAAVGAGATSIAFGIRGGDDGTGAGDRTSVALSVEQDFEPDNPQASVSVSVQCTEGGAPDASPKPASEGAPAVFAISDFGEGAACSASLRAPPTGYTTDASDCQNVSIADSDSPSCTITSRRKASSTAFTVTKDFEPGNQASVSVSVSCTRGGRPDASPKPVREGAPAVFIISGFNPGATCTATEGPAPADYTSSERGCRDVPIARGNPAACTIINTHKKSASVTFTVIKDFEPDDADSSVSISVSCTGGGTPDVSPRPVSEGAPAVFTISGFAPGATCTATEGAAPSGYTTNSSDCRGVSLDSAGECTIVNTLNSATFTVRKDFEDDSVRPVTISVTCTNGGAPDESPKAATEASPAVFTITGFTAGATCTATEAPTGYSPNESDCQDVPLESDGECTIKNLIVE